MVVLPRFGKDFLDRSKYFLGESRCGGWFGVHFVTLNVKMYSKSTLFVGLI